MKTREAVKTSAATIENADLSAAEQEFNKALRFARYFAKTASVPI